MPFRSPARLVAFALALAFALPLVAGCGGGARTALPVAPSPPALDSDGSPIVAQWTADTLSLVEFEEAFAQSDGIISDTVANPLERRQDFLNRFVNFKLKVLAAREAGYDDDSSYQAEVESYRDQLAGPYFTDKEIFDDIVRDIYDKQAEEVRVRHILFRPRGEDTMAVYTEAVAVRDSIAAGQLDFVAAAQAYSGDPSVETNNGDIGYVTGGLTVLPFEDLTYNTPVGDVGGPIRTSFGYHVIEVLDRRPTRGDIEARHILISPEGEEPADTLAAYQTIVELKERVEAGEDFGDLARQYSDDTGSGAQGGDLGSFGAGRMVPPFEQAAFELANVGDLSEPVRTRFGYHLIQLTGKPERPSYEESYDALKQRAQRLPRTALKRDKVTQAYRDSIGSTFDEVLLREALSQVPDDSLTAMLLIDGFGPEYASRAFATVGDSTYTLSQLMDTYRRTPNRTTFGGEPRSYAQVYVDAAQGFLNEAALGQAIRDLENRDPEFRRIFRGYADGVLYFRIAEDSVWTRAKEDDEGLQTFYATRQGEYRYPERRRVLAFRSPSDSLLQAVIRQLDAGQNARALFAAHTDTSIPLRLDTVYVADSTRSALDQTLALQVGEHTPIVAERTRSAIYVLDGIEAPRAKTFDEARAEISTGYQEVLERTWEARLRERYNAEIYPDRIPPRPFPASAPTPDADASSR
ncbi:MAG: peptidylprolyl isomerase [Rubricoccaceae bacterium]